MIDKATILTFDNGSVSSSHRCSFRHTSFWITFQRSSVEVRPRLWVGWRLWGYMPTARGSR